MSFLWTGFLFGCRVVKRPACVFFAFFPFFLSLSNKRGGGGGGGISKKKGAAGRTQVV